MDEDRDLLRYARTVGSFVLIALVAFVVIFVVTLLSTLYPARIATQVQPVVAMQGN